MPGYDVYSLCVCIRTLNDFIPSSCEMGTNGIYDIVLGKHG